MPTFNETDASLNRVLAEGRLVDSLVDVIYRASRSPYDYVSGIADVDAIRGAVNAQTGKRAMFVFHGREQDTDLADALEGFIEEWKKASRISGPGRRTVPLPALNSLSRFGKTGEKIIRDAKLPPPLSYPKAYQKEKNLIEAALYMAKYNLESVHQAIVALSFVAGYIGSEHACSKLIRAEVDKLRDGLWARARDFSRDEMMFTLLLQSTAETTALRRTLLKDAVGPGMSIMHFLSQFGQLGSYESAEEERFRKQLDAAAKTKGYAE